MSKISIFKVAPRKGDPLFNPYVKIWVSEYSGDSKGNVFISPNLMTETEIDYHVDSLIEQLEKARKKAKKDIEKK